MVDECIGIILAKFIHIPQAARGIFLIGVEYYFKAQEISGTGDIDTARALYRRAIDVLEEIFKTAESTRHYGNSHYTRGMAYRRLGDFFEAADAFFMSIDTNPNHQYADAMHWMIADSYEKMKRAGQVDPQDADAIILWAYETFFEEYPDSRMVGFAARELARVHVQQGRPVTAAGYLYWLMDYEAANGYRYTRPETTVDNLLRRLGHRKECSQ